MSVHAVKDKADLEALIRDNGLLVVDFFATWCGPCKVVAPVLEKWAQEMTPGESETDRPSVRFAKVDVDMHSMIASEHSVNAMPTFLIFYKGELFKTIVGANVPVLRNVINDLVDKLKAAGRPASVVAEGVLA